MNLNHIKHTSMTSSRTKIKRTMHSREKYANAEGSLEKRLIARAEQAGSTDVEHNIVSGSSPQESGRGSSLPVQFLEEISTALCIPPSPKLLVDLKRAFSLKSRLFELALFIPNPRLQLRRTTEVVRAIVGV